MITARRVCARRAGSAQSKLVLPDAKPVPVEPINAARSVVVALEPTARSVGITTGSDYGVDVVSCAGPVASGDRRRAADDDWRNGPTSLSPGENRRPVAGTVVCLGRRDRF